ncbi:MAG: hypothetical protein JWM16_5319 [Verrucomicrobiales bacterium]|nr:hypothetical protein [Verrucomicrobiales bacterium]
MLVRKFQKSRMRERFNVNPVVVFKYAKGHFWNMAHLSPTFEPVQEGEGSEPARFAGSTMRSTSCACTISLRANSFSFNAATDQDNTIQSMFFSARPPTRRSMASALAEPHLLVNDNSFHKQRITAWNPVVSIVPFGP